MRNFKMGYFNTYGRWVSDEELMHVGRSKLDGAKRGSGRFPLGSGERPNQHRGMAAGVSQQQQNDNQSERHSAGIKVQGRDFKLGISYDVYSNEKVTSKQKQIARSVSKADYKSMEKELKKYVENNDGDSLKDFGETKVSNIFRYVIPKDVYIPRSADKFGVMCNYRFDPEHGLVCIFKKGKCVYVGPQDAIL